jgi:hypothetical protein
MWLGEQITERGVGNGISMIILSSIMSGLPSAIGGTLELVNTGGMNQAMPFLLAFLILGVTAIVVFMERAQRRIAVNYAKRQQGRRMYAGQTSHLPFKINMSGVIPPIFASSLILFPATIATWFGSSQAVPWLQRVAASLSPGQPVYIILYASLIMFFCFFYTALVFNSRETADNLRRSGAFIPGIRPGQQTAEYIDKVLTRLTFWGALYPGVQRAVLLRRHVAADHRRSHDGLHGAAPGSHDDSPIRRAAQEGESPWLREERLLGSRLEFRDESQSIGAQDLSEVQGRPPSRRRARDLRGSAPQAAAGLSARSAK